MSLKTTRKDKGADRIKKVARDYNGKYPYVAVGILGTGGTHFQVYTKAGTAQAAKVLTNAEIGAIHEFGSSDGRVPQRSFLRGTADLKMKEMKEVGKQLYHGVISGKMTVEKALGVLGLKFQALVRERIRSGIQPENDPATIARKGSSTPLIDTGQLVNSINFQVHSEGD